MNHLAVPNNGIESVVTHYALTDKQSHSSRKKKLNFEFSFIIASIQNKTKSSPNANQNLTAKLLKQSNQNISYKKNSTKIPIKQLKHMVKILF